MNKKKIVFLYFVFGVCWIFATDYLVRMFVTPEMYVLVQIGKGLVFVILTSAVIYFIFNKLEELNNMKEQEQKLSTLINSMVDFVIFKDGEGRWLEANDFGLKLFQLEHVDYRGKTDVELAEHTGFYQGALMYCDKSDQEAWENGEITRCEEVIPLPDDSNKYFDTVKVPLFNEDGSRKGLVVIGRDVTDKKQAEEELRKREKLSIVGELAASVGHEIRNPLTSIKGFLQLLKEDKKNESYKNYYNIMLSELDRINQIVGELLILAKPQAMSFTRCNLQVILKDVLCLLETQANMNNVGLAYYYDEDAHVSCEGNKLKQVFINLIKNAIEASEGGGEVRIEMKKLNDGNVCVSVMDNGCGIPEHIFEKLGEPFYSSKEKGTGLGVMVSNKIIDEHKGNLAFASKEGEGTTVEVVLPLVEKQEQD